LKKLGISQEEFERIMNEPPKSFLDYKSYFSIIRKIEKPLKWGTRAGIVPDTVYRKYFMLNLK